MTDPHVGTSSRDGEGLAARLRELAADLSDATTAFCAQLVRSPSINGRDSEAGVVEIVARYAQEYSLPLRRIEAASGHPTLLVGPTAGSEVIGEGGLLLVGHTDTVPEGDPTHWRHPPFGAEIEDGRLYGRGACDNKGGIAAAFFALVALQRAGLLDQANATLLCVPDEESGATGALGITPVLRTGQLHARGAIYTYPSLHEIPIGHRGLLRLTVTAHGESLHTGSHDWQERSRGANAVLAMAELLLALERLDLNAGLPRSDPVWREWRGVLTPGTTIAGGAGQSIVPDRCSATVDVRLVQGHQPEAVLEQIQDVAAEIAARRERISFAFQVDSALPPTAIPVDAPIVRAVGEACDALLGTQPPLVIAGPANEGYLLNQGNIPTICGFGPVGERAHAPDEYVELASLPLAAALYALTAVRLRAVAPRGLGGGGGGTRRAGRRWQP